MSDAPAFDRMRADLVERGLLSADFALTEAGSAYTRGLIDGLKQVEAENDPSGPRVRWNHKGRGLAPRVADAQG